MSWKFAIVAAAAAWTTIFFLGAVVNAVSDSLFRPLGQNDVVIGRSGIFKFDYLKYKNRGAKSELRKYKRDSINLPEIR